MHPAEKLINALESKIQFADYHNPEISSVNAGWHIEHSLLVIIKIAEAVGKSDPRLYKNKFNWKRSLIFAFNRIPRGKAKAPKAVQPQAELNITSLANRILEARKAVSVFKKTDPNNYFFHPYLGNLNSKQTIHFLGIHTRHHLKIINDLIGRAK